MMSVANKNKTSGADRALFTVLFVTLAMQPASAPTLTRLHIQAHLKDEGEVHFRPELLEGCEGEGAASKDSFLESVQQLLDICFPRGKF